MKTNHQRGFKAKGHNRGRYMIFGEEVKASLSDKVIGAYAFDGDACCGKRGVRRDRRGAKKFINSRVRFHEKMALSKMVKIKHEE
jgi:hypothetical protein